MGLGAAAERIRGGKTHLSVESVRPAPD